MRTTIKLALAGITVLALGAQAQAQGAYGPGGCSGGRGARAAGVRLFDPKTLATVSGEVVAVTPTGPAGLGIHLELKTTDGTMAVHLGPSWFLKEQGLEVATGDQLEISGSRVVFEGKPAVIAQTVKKANQAIALRDAAGFPVWAGRGGGGGRGR